MAQGDIKSNIVIIPANADAIVRPAVGEHWIIKQLVSNNFGTSYIDNIYIGTSNFKINLFNTGASPPDGIRDMLAEYWTQSSAGNKATINGIYINNDVYLILHNAWYVELAFVYAGIQIK